MNASPTNDKVISDCYSGVVQGDYVRSWCKQLGISSGKEGSPSGASPIVPEVDVEGLKPPITTLLNARLFWMNGCPV